MLRTMLQRRRLFDGLRRWPAAIYAGRIHTTPFAAESDVKDDQLMKHSFETKSKKEKETFLETIRVYQLNMRKRTDHMAFIYTAMKFMDLYGVSQDLEVYKKLIDIFPKEKMIPTNVFQTAFQHYPRDQQCAIDILEKMEDNGVIPDKETQDMLLNVFGQHGYPLQKFWTMMYWMPKFKNLTPWPVPRPIPTDPFVLAKLAIEKIMSVDVLSEVLVLDTKNVKDSIEKTWIVSGIAPKQSQLLEDWNKNEAIYVKGPHKVWVANQAVDYFVLLGKPTLTRKKYTEVDEDG